MRNNNNKKASQMQRQVSYENGFYYEVFKSYDRNGDGVLNLKELRAAMQQLGLNPKKTEIDEIMALYDHNGMFVYLFIYKDKFRNRKFEK